MNSLSISNEMDFDIKDLKSSDFRLTDISGHGSPLTRNVYLNEKWKVISEQVTTLWSVLSSCIDPASIVFPNQVPPPYKHDSVDAQEALIYYGIKRKYNHFLHIFLPWFSILCYTTTTFGDSPNFLYRKHYGMIIFHVEFTIHFQPFFN